MRRLLGSLSLHPLTQMHWRLRYIRHCVQNRHLLGSQETQEVHYLLTITVR